MLVISLEACLNRWTPLVNYIPAANLNKLHHLLHFTASVCLQGRMNWGRFASEQQRHQTAVHKCSCFCCLAEIRKLHNQSHLNYSVHVNIVSDEVMRVVGGQCKVWRNVMTLWHLVQIDSRCNRQTDRHIELDCWTDKQTDRAGSWSAFSSMTSGTSSLEGSVDPGRQRWRGHQLSAGRVQHTAVRLLTDLWFGGVSRRGKTLPCSSSEQPPPECRREEQQEPRGGWS